MIPQLLADGMTNPEWVKAHVGCLTGSRMADAMAVTKAKNAWHIISADGEVTKVGNGATAEKKVAAAMAKGLRCEVMEYEPAGEYAKRWALKKAIAAERLTGFAVDRFVTDAMQWGIDHEPAAKEAFEAHSGLLLEPAGFILHPTIECYGATPDAFVVTSLGRGVFEAKCPTTDTHIEWLLAGVVPPEYRPQMITEMSCSGCTYGVFVSYDPRLPPGKNLFVKTYIPTQEEWDDVLAHARQFLAEVDQLHERLMAIEPDTF